MPSSTDVRAGLWLHPAFYVAAWILLSNVTILLNRWIIDSAGFRYPTVLTWWHMAFATVVTQILARTTSLFDGRHQVKMTPLVFVTRVMPIGVMHCGSMVGHNLIYLYLSVPLIQMLKGLAPLTVLFIGWIWGVEKFSVPKLSKLLIVVVGVAMSSFGELRFSWQGAVYEFAYLGFESGYIIMIQYLISPAGLNMDPLVSLYYFAPVCAVANFGTSYVVGWSRYEWTHAVEVGPWMLLLNAVVALGLIVSTLLLMGKTSGVAMPLVDTYKNMLLVLAAVCILGTPVTPVQVVGYAVALLGFLLYLSDFQEVRTSIANLVEKAPLEQEPPSEKPQPTRNEKRLTAVVIALMVVTTVLVVLFTRTKRMYDLVPSTTTTIYEAERLSRGWLTWVHLIDAKWWIANG